MESLQQTPSAEPGPGGTASEHAAWGLTTRIAFRFCLIYLGTYSLATQILGSMVPIPGISFRGLGLLWPFREITFWLGHRVFQLPLPLAFEGNSRDTEFYWVQIFWLLAAAGLLTALWSVVDRQRTNYSYAHRWFRLFVRIGLASQMFEYGMTKVIPNQFPAPSLVTLVTPTGNLPLQGMLWTSIGAATSYQMFTGLAELLGGVLLLFPSTTTLGALLCLAELSEIFVLNLAYDLGVKQLSFHLILLALFLVVPEIPRLVRLFGGQRADPLTSKSAPFRGMGALPIALGVYLIGVQAYVNWAAWDRDGGGKPRSAFYGIWDIETLSVDGVVRPARLNDYDRQWRRVLFDGPEEVVFQRLDDSFARYQVAVDAGAKSLSLRKGGSSTWKSQFRIEPQNDEFLLLEGDMDQQHIQMQLHRVNFDTLRVLNSHFRWVRPPEP